MDEVFDELDLVQLVDFVTWSRLVNGVWRKSIIDHVYTKDVTLIEGLEAVETIVGDHRLVVMTVDGEKTPAKITYRRD